MYLHYYRICGVRFRQECSEPWLSLFYASSCVPGSFYARMPIVFHVSDNSPIPRREPSGDIKSFLSWCIETMPTRESAPTDEDTNRDHEPID